MKVAIHPTADPAQEVDITHRLVSAIAEELWRLYGGNEHLNWVEAERQLAQIGSEARRMEAASAAPTKVGPPRRGSSHLARRPGAVPRRGAPAHAAGERSERVH